MDHLTFRLLLQPNLDLTSLMGPLTPDPSISGLVYELTEGNYIEPFLVLLRQSHLLLHLLDMLLFILSFFRDVLYMEV